MKLADYFRILWRRKWIIGVMLLISTALALWVTARTPPTYTATTTLRVLSSSAGLGSWQQIDVVYTERLMGSYARIATSAPVLDDLVTQLDLHERPAVRVEPIPTTELMAITVEHTDPAEAALIANTLADLLVRRGDELYSGMAPTATDILLDRINQIDADLRAARREYDDLLRATADAAAESDGAANVETDPRLAALQETIDLKEQLYANLLVQYENVRTADVLRANQVYVVEPAAIPPGPTSPNIYINAALGVGAGLVSGLALAVLAEHLDDRLHTPDAITACSALPILGKLPARRPWRGRRLVRVGSPSYEAFRRLRATILALVDDAPLRTLLITSADPREGKSTVAANLALVLARTGQRVVVVDADLRRPRLHTLFGLPNTTGLGDILTHAAPLDTALAAALHAIPLDDDPRHMAAPRPASTAPGNSTDSADAAARAAPPDASPGGGSLHVLVSGTADAVDLLDSARMAALLDRLRARCDIIVIDTPAFLAVTDAALLARAVDGVLLVVRRGAAHGAAVAATCEQLRHIGAGLLGVVANGTRPNRAYRYVNGQRRRAGQGATLALRAWPAPTSAPERAPDASAAVPVRHPGQTASQTESQV